MKDAAITYGGLCVPQGQTKHGNAPILDTGYSMPITVVNGAFDGPIPVFRQRLNSPMNWMRPRFTDK